MKRVLVLILMMGVVVFAAMAKGSSEKSSTATTASGGTSSATIGVLAQKSMDMDYLLSIVPSFTKKTGVKVNFTQVSYGDMETKATLALSSHTGQYDALELYTEMFPTVAAGNWLISFEDLASKYSSVPPIDISQYLDNYIKYYTVDNKVYSIPIQPDTRLLFQNDGWLSQANLSSPQTWAELEKAAAHFTQPSQNKWGFMTSTSQQGWIPLTWIAVVYSAGTGIFDSHNLPVLTSPKVVSATKFYVKLVREYGPQSARNEVGQQVEAAMQHNQVAFGLADTVYTAKGYSTGLFPVSDVGITRYGSAEIGGWSFSVVKGGKEKPAYQFVQWATSPTTELDVAINARHTSGVKSVWQDAHFQQLNPFWKGDFAALSAAEPFAPYPVEPKISDILSTNLSKMVAGTISVDAGLAQAQSQIKSLMINDGFAK